MGERPNFRETINVLRKGGKFWGNVFRKKSVAAEKEALRIKVKSTANQPKEKAKTTRDEFPADK